MVHRSLWQNDDGFTLIELLVAMVVVGIIAGAIGASIIVFLRDSGAVSDRVALAHDQQLLAVYLDPDVQSALSASSSVTGSGCTSGTKLLTLSWSETLSTTTNYSSTYQVVSQGGQWQITRTLAVNGVNQPNPQIVAHALTSSSAASITCSVSGSHSITMTFTEASGSASVTASRRGP